MREAVKRFWRINGILGGSAILVTLVVGFGDIGSYVSKLLGNSKPEADVASAVPPDRPPPPVSTASSPPPPPVSRPADLAPKVNPKPRAAAPRVPGQRQGRREPGANDRGRRSHGQRHLPYGRGRGYYDAACAPSRW
jgi:hypothetical protein